MTAKTIVTVGILVCMALGLALAGWLFVANNAAAVHAMLRRPGRLVRNPGVLWGVGAPCEQHFTKHRAVDFGVWLGFFGVQRLAAGLGPLSAPYTVSVPRPRTHTHTNPV